MTSLRVSGPFRHLDAANKSDSLKQQMHDAWYVIAGSYQKNRFQWGLVDFINPIPKALAIAHHKIKKSWKSLTITATVFLPISIAIIIVVNILSLCNYILSGVLMLLALPVVGIKKGIEYGIAHKEKHDAPENFYPDKITNTKYQRKYVKNPNKLVEQGAIAVFEQDDFIVDEKIGAGGFADAYRAYHNDQTIAIKLPSRTLKDKTPQDLTREAVFQYLAQSDNIVPLIAIAKYQNQIGIAMPYYPEGNLFMRLHQNPAPLLDNQKFNIAYDIASAIAYLAKQGIIHRDIKSGNVLITASGHGKLSDFGIATLVTETTEKSRLVGTWQYIAPEIKNRQGADIKSDVYSYGVLLQELMERKAPSKTHNTDTTFVPIPDITLRELPITLPTTAKSLITRTRKTNLLLRASAKEVVDQLEPEAHKVDYRAFS